MPLKTRGVIVRKYSRRGRGVRLAGGRHKRRGRGVNLAGGKITWNDVKRFAGKARDFLKKTKAISTAADMAGFKDVANSVRMHGFGRRRRKMTVRRRRRGRGVNLAGGMTKKTRAIGY